MNKKKNIEDIYPLSPMQQGILFHSILNPDSDIYITQICLTLEGDINTNNIQQAWQEIINRHQVCRAAFRWEKKDKTFQVIYKQVELPWVEKDWQGYTSEEQENKLQEYLIADKKQGFDLKRSPLIRLSLIKLNKTTYRLIWTLHHLILDGWSLSLILKEFFKIYNGLSCQTPIPYGQYIAWLNNQDLDVAKIYWKNKLQGFTAPTNLKIYGQNLDKNRITRSQQIRLSSKITDSLTSLAKKYNLTLNAIIQGTFAILLSRYTDCKDIVYGTTTSGRPANFPGIESMVGLFINTLPMRVKISDTELLLPWLAKLQQQQVENLEYEYTPLATIQELSDIPLGLPLFENIFVFENYPVDTKLLSENKKLKIKSIDLQEFNNFPLTCLVKVSSELSIEIQHDNNRFTSDTIKQILESFEYLITQIVDNPQQYLGKLSILTPKNKELIESWQQTEVNYPLDKTIPELFLEQVNKTPDANALIFADKQYTYQELNNEANQLANYLIELGVKPETPVGIYLDRSEKMAIAILAIIKAGGAYVPLDPSYPQNRINFIIQDTGINIILTKTQYTKKINTNSLNIINLNIFSPTSSAPPLLCYPATSASSATLLSNNAAYIIYTSGSTGKPKGVINTHRSLVNRLLWMQDAYQLDSQDKVLQKTPFSFDVSVWEFFWTWLNGACLVIAKPEVHKDSNCLVKLINQAGITVMHFVPSMLQVFLEESNVSSCKSLKQVICSGEALPTSTKNKFFAKLDAKLHNLYGPTEAAIDITSYQCLDDKNDIVPIGKAIANTQIYILNSQQQINPIGVPGELHIGGVGLARGYLNRPELTAEKFIPNPFTVNSLSPSAPLPPCPSAPLLYKTGDLACYLPGGNIQFLGRIDNNIKIRGFRIELGEIETVLEQHSAVQQTVVIIREDMGINPKIVAYLTGNQNKIPKINRDEIIEQLRDRVQSELPYYMIPDAFILIENFPLNPNGKLNRKALPKPTIEAKTFIPPRNSLEAKIAVIWQNILQLEKVSIEDNFFELGGNSLSATRVNSRIKEELSIELPLRTIFEKPTIASIATRIQLMEMVVKQQSSSSLKNKQVKKKEMTL